MVVKKNFAYSFNGRALSSDYNKIFELTPEIQKIISASPHFRKLTEIFVILNDLKLVQKKDFPKKKLFEFGIGKGESAYFYKRIGLNNFWGCELVKTKEAEDSFPRRCFFGDGIEFMKNMKKSNSKYDIVTSILFSSGNLDPIFFIDFFINVINIMRKDSILLIDSDDTTMNYMQKHIFTKPMFSTNFEVISRFSSQSVPNAVIIKLK